MFKRQLTIRETKLAILLFWDQTKISKVQRRILSSKKERKLPAVRRRIEGNFSQFSLNSEIQHIKENKELHFIIKSCHEKGKYVNEANLLRNIFGSTESLTISDLINYKADT